jgi:hypothetical protein
MLLGVPWPYRVVPDDRNSGRGGPEPTGTRWVHAEPAGGGVQRARAVTTGNKEAQVRPPTELRPGLLPGGGPEFESPHPAAASPTGSCPRSGGHRGRAHPAIELEPSPPEIVRHPLAHPTLVLSANPKSLPPARLHDPDVTLTFHIALLRFEYAEERRHRGCTGRQSCEGRLGHGRLAGVFCRVR